jgi:hypothetical protein
MSSLAMDIQRRDLKVTRHIVPKVKEKVKAEYTDVGVVRSDGVHALGNDG